MMFRTFMLGLLSALQSMSLAHASAQPFSVHGFVSQGLSQSSANHWFGQSQEQTSLDMQQLGLNFNYQSRGAWWLAAQGLYSKLNQEDAQSSLDYAFWGYRLPNAAENTETQVKLGRQKLHLGLYNQTRDVPSTRPSILLPQSIYYERHRQLFLSMDGLGWERTWLKNTGTYRLNLLAGLPTTDEKSVEVAVLSADYAGELRAKAGFNLQLNWENAAYDTRASLSYLHGRMDYSPSDAQGDVAPDNSLLCLLLGLCANATPTGDLLTQGRFEFNYLVASYQKDLEDWTFSGEYGLKQNRYSQFGSRFEDTLYETRYLSEGGYLQALWRASPKLSYLGRAEYFVLNRNDRDGTRQSAAYQNFYAPHAFYGKDLMLGASYQWTPSLELRGEIHRFNGTAFLTYEDNPDPSQTQKDWTLGLLQLNYRF